MRLSFLAASIIFCFGCSSDDDGGQNVVNGDPYIRRITTNPYVDERGVVSPDGSTIVFVSERAGTGQYRLWRVAFGGGTEEQLTTEDAQLPRFSTNGDFIYFSSFRAGGDVSLLYRMPANGGPATEVPGSFPGNAVLSPDGQWFVYPVSVGDEGNSHLWKRSAPNHAEPAIQLTDGSHQDQYPAWSPDGNKIVFTRDDPEDTDRHLYVINADGTDFAPLTDISRNVYEKRPAWSPDGAWIAFERGGETEERIFKVRETGETSENPAIQLTFNPDIDEDDGNPNWSADGKWIVFDSDRDDNIDVYVIPPEGEPEPETKSVSTGILDPR